LRAAKTLKEKDKVDRKMFADMLRQVRRVPR